MDMRGYFVAFVVGVALAVANYATLWFTVKRLVLVRRPMVLAFGSFLARTALVILGFYLVTRGEPVSLFACVLGFLLVRTLAVRYMARAKAGCGGNR